MLFDGGRADGVVAFVDVVVQIVVIEIDDELLDRLAVTIK